MWGTKDDQIKRCFLVDDETTKIMRVMYVMQIADTNFSRIRKSYKSEYLLNIGVLPIKTIICFFLIFKRVKLISFQISLRFQLCFINLRQFSISCWNGALSCF